MICSSSSLGTSELMQVDKQADIGEKTEEEAQGGDPPRYLTSCRQHIISSVQTKRSSSQPEKKKIISKQTKECHRQRRTRNPFNLGCAHAIHSEMRPVPMGAGSVGERGEAATNEGA